jgi:hypothetical protein
MDKNISVIWDLFCAFGTSEFEGSNSKMIMVKQLEGVHLSIRAVNTQQLVCGVLSQCNIYLKIYKNSNYMFRPFKRVIVRLHFEPVVDIQWGCGGTRSRLTKYIWGSGIFILIL